MNHCNVIRDLMSLAAEGLSSRESRQLVEEHITTCPVCRAEWEQMREQEPPAISEALPLHKIDREIRRKRWLWALLMVFLAVALGLAFTAFATDRQYVPYEDGLLEIHQKDGVLLVKATRPGMYVALDLTPWHEAQGVMMADISLYTRRLEGKASEVPHQVAADLPQGARVSAWYVEPGHHNRFLYGANPLSGGVISLPRLALAYYVLFALAAAAVLLVLLLFLRKKTATRRVLWVLLGLPLAWLGGHFLVKGFSTLSWYSLGRDMAWIGACGFFLYAAWLFAGKIRAER
jgi:hypothetical protein